MFQHDADTVCSVGRNCSIYGVSAFAVFTSDDCLVALLPTFVDASRHASALTILSHATYKVREAGLARVSWKVE